MKQNIYSVYNIYRIEYIHFNFYFGLMNANAEMQLTQNTITVRKFKLVL